MSHVVLWKFSRLTVLCWSAVSPQLIVQFVSFCQHMICCVRKSSYSHKTSVCPSFGWSTALSLHRPDWYFLSTKELSSVSPSPLFWIIHMGITEEFVLGDGFNIGHGINRTRNFCSFSSKPTWSLTDLSVKHTTPLVCVNNIIYSALRNMGPPDI